MTQTEPLSIQPAELMDRLLEAEQRLAAVQHEVEHLNRLAMVGTLAAGVVHEINNALTPLLSYAQLAIGAPADHELSRQVAQKAVNAIDRVTQITDAILGYVRPEDEEAAAAADVGGCIDEVFSCLATPAGQDRVEVVVETPAGCRVRMRPVALQQVLMNLVLNAREAMAVQGGGRLTIRAECSPWNTGPQAAAAGVPGGDARVRIFVEDTGPGIDGKVLEQLFRPFVTGGKSGRKGNGLGLAVSERLVSQADGRIWAEAGAERGAVFVVELLAA